jgi:hypothetical protein
MLGEVLSERRNLKSKYAPGCGNRRDQSIFHSSLQLLVAGVRV